MKVVDYESKIFKSAYKKVVNRLDLGENRLDGRVREILNDVRRTGDRAVIRYTLEFDRLKLTPSEMRVPKDRFKAAYRAADPMVVKSLRYAAKRITTFHQRQKQKSWSIRKEGVYLGQRLHPIERVGLYVPGGKAAYPSSVLMTAIPARVAGVPKVRICTPMPDGIVNPYILIAADIAGVTEIYRIGGVQAIAALAYGTKTIPKVDKIVGPGNQYVAAAKRLVYGLVDIDMVAGPSELLIISDAKANPRYLASDLISQAEHDEDAVVIHLSTSARKVAKVMAEIAVQLKALPRRKIAETALRRNGVAFIVPNIQRAIAMANEIAPEHLSVFVDKPFQWLDKIVHAGAIFLGEETPQSLGDYIAGPNHVLPTGGTARFFSPLSVDDFIRKSSVISYSKSALKKSGDHLVRIANIEGLTAHANMVTIRI